MGPESRLEARCNALARGMGCESIKLGGFVVGLPDRLYLLPGGRAWLVEFKAGTEQPSLRQKFEFLKLGELGHPVEVIRSAPHFERLLCGKLGLPVPARVMAQLGLNLT
jgi:hypothetical protein